MKKIIMLFLASLAFLYADEKEDMIEKAINTFSKSPFETLYFEGGAFFSGDGVSEMPATIRFYSKKHGDVRHIDAVDGLFGNTMFDVKIRNNMANIIVSDWDVNINSQISGVSFDAPVLKYPKIYTDALMYVFVDKSKDILKKDITLGANWHVLKLDYKDRVDTITFSAKTMRVRTYVSEYYNNKITIDFALYTNVRGVNFPTSYTLKSVNDKIEVRLNVANIIDSSSISKAPKDFIIN